MHVMLRFRHRLCNMYQTFSTHVCFFQNGASIDHSHSYNAFAFQTGYWGLLQFHVICYECRHNTGLTAGRSTVIEPQQLDSYRRTLRDCRTSQSRVPYCNDRERIDGNVRRLGLWTLVYLRQQQRLRISNRAEGWATNWRDLVNDERVRCKHEGKIHITYNRCESRDLCHQSTRLI